MGACFHFPFRRKTHGGALRRAQSKAMIKHLVFWKLKENSPDGTKEENGEQIAALLCALADAVPGILRIEVGKNFNPSDAAFDLALFSEFESRDALERYQRHPDHVAAKEFIDRVTGERAVVDYEAE